MPSSAGGDAFAIDDDFLAAASDVEVFLDVVDDDAAHFVLDRINIAGNGRECSGRSNRASGTRCRGLPFDDNAAATMQVLP
jgi:hypothetical protein